MLPTRHRIFGSRGAGMPAGQDFTEAVDEGWLEPGGRVIR
jgi:hypothetical protein